MKWRDVTHVVFVVGLLMLLWCGALFEMAAIWFLWMLMTRG